MDGLAAQPGDAAGIADLDRVDRGGIGEDADLPLDQAAVAVVDHQRRGRAAGFVDLVDIDPRRVEGRGACADHAGILDQAAIHVDAVIAADDLAVVAQRADAELHAVVEGLDPAADLVGHVETVAPLDPLVPVGDQLAAVDDGEVVAARPQRPPAGFDPAGVDDGHVVLVHAHRVVVGGEDLAIVEQREAGARAVGFDAPVVGGDLARGGVAQGQVLAGELHRFLAVGAFDRAGIGHLDPVAADLERVLAVAVDAGAGVHRDGGVVIGDQDRAGLEPRAGDVAAARHALRGGGLGGKGDDAGGDGGEENKFGSHGCVRLSVGPGTIAQGDATAGIRNR